MQRTLIAFISICIIWFEGIRPLVGEIHYFNYLKTRESSSESFNYLEKAIKYNHGNTQYLIEAAKRVDPVSAVNYLNEAINSFNGDTVLWSLYGMRGELYFVLRNIPLAEPDLLDSLYYKPDFKPAVSLLFQINQIKERYRNQ